jgi:PhnB protein
MRFMMIVKPGIELAPGEVPSEEMIAEMGRFNEEMMKAGVLVDLSGLQPSAQGARVQFSRGKRTLVDGPFAETKELVGGYWIINVKSREEAIDWAMRAPCPSGKGGDAEIEVRQFFELEDFGETAAVEKAKELAKELKGEKTAGPTIRPNIYLNFNGTCEEAFRFYERAIGAKIECLLRHAGTPAEAHVPAEWQQKIMHGRLNVNGEVIMASDAFTANFQPPQGFSVALQIKDVAEAERSFRALSENGQVKMPLQETFWATRFGMLVDQYGIPWMINCEKPA